MKTNTVCSNCDRELTGAIETTTTTEGVYVLIVQAETSDCNWTRCTGCKTVSCKACRYDRPQFCCVIGRAIDEERARVQVANAR